MFNWHSVALMVCVGSGAAGCAVGPDYHRPDLPVPPAYRINAGDAGNRLDGGWWAQFQDPTLDTLIREALADNPDVRIAAARVEEYSGRLETTRASLFPQLNYGASLTRERASSAGASRAPAGISPVVQLATAAVSASWELDLWGRLRRATEAARADLLTTEAAHRGTELTLISQLAKGYLTLLSLDRQLEITRGTVATRARSLELFQARYEGGVLSEVDLSQARSEYEAANASVPDLESAIHRQENALCVLLGRNPGSIAREKLVGELAVPVVPAGLPADLLARRPDVVGAEDSLIAANARIGVARALYFPSISLTGALGTSSSQVRDLFTGPARIWSYTGNVTGPIFAAGAIHGTVRQAQAQHEQQLLNYQKVLQNAFREVDDALMAETKVRERAFAQQREVDALQTYFEQAQAVYEGGYSSYIEVLDAQRSLFGAQLAYAQSEADERTALVDLYVAMGGGWESKVR